MHAGNQRKHPVQASQNRISQHWIGTSQWYVYLLLTHVCTVCKIMYTSTCIYLLMYWYIYHIYHHTCNCDYIHTRTNIGDRLGASSEIKKTDGSADSNVRHPQIQLITQFTSRNDCRANYQERTQDIKENIPLKLPKIELPNTASTLPNGIFANLHQYQL